MMFVLETFYDVTKLTVDNLLFSPAFTIDRFSVFILRKTVKFIKNGSYNTGIFFKIFCTSTKLTVNVFFSFGCFPS